MKPFHIYILGYVLSLALTVAAFAPVAEHLRTQHLSPSHTILLPLLVALAVMQLFVQVIFFLHLGQEERPRWNLLAFVFALIAVALLVGGTLWIMHNLEHQQLTGGAPFINGDISPQTEK